MGSGDNPNEEKKMGFPRPVMGGPFTSTICGVPIGELVSVESGNALSVSYDGKLYVSDKAVVGPTGPMGAQGPAGQDFPDAPNDGRSYVRKNKQWVPLEVVLEEALTALLVQKRTDTPITFDEMIGTILHGHKA